METSSEFQGEDGKLVQRVNYWNKKINKILDASVKNILTTNKNIVRETVQNMEDLLIKLILEKYELKYKLEQCQTNYDKLIHELKPQKKSYAAIVGKAIQLEQSGTTRHAEQLEAQKSMESHAQHATNKQQMKQMDLNTGRNFENSLLLGHNFNIDESDRLRTLIIEASPSVSPGTIKNLLEKYVDCRELDVKIERIIYNRKKKLIIKLENSEQAERLSAFIKSLKFDIDLVITTPAYIYRRLLFTRVSKALSSADIISFLSEKFGVSPDYFSVKIFNKKNTDFNTWLIWLPSMIAEFLLTVKSISLNFNTIYIQPFVNIIRCFRCQEYGHVHNICKNDVVCPNCSEGHTPANCNSEQYKCINCDYNGYDSTLCQHRASDPKCHTYLDIIKREKDGEKPVFVRQVRTHVFEDNIEEVISVQHNVDVHVDTELTGIPDDDMEVSAPGIGDVNEVLSAQLQVQEKEREIVKEAPILVENAELREDSFLGNTTEINRQTQIQTLPTVESEQLSPALLKNLGTQRSTSMDSLDKLSVDSSQSSTSTQRTLRKKRTQSSRKN